MENYNENQFLTQIARRYAEHYGEILNAENAGLERQKVLTVTPGLDKKISRIGKTSGARRFYGGLSALAAAVLLMLMIPRLISLNDNGVMSPAPSAPASSGAEHSAAAPAPQPSAAEAEHSASAPPPQSSPAEPAPELLPLTFTLPDNFRVTDSELDNGKSVYYLSNAFFDDVVMTMELDSDENVFAELSPLEINGQPVYYKYTSDFSVMAFEKRGITYVLTCKYDVNTLVPLAEAIL